MQIDWPVLRAAAADVAGRAYAPYSRLRVGASGLTGDGLVVTGRNVENASFGLTLCAERGLVSALHATPPTAAGAARPALVAGGVGAGAHRGPAAAAGRRSPGPGGGRRRRRRRRRAAAVRALPPAPAGGRRAGA